MAENVFEIRGLDCAYRHNGKTVLAIESLDIPKGKITTILGKSGSGKSTLIETLGMMNNTIKHGSVRFLSDGTTETIDRTIWENPDTLSLIRNKHFSFIFQNDYLMPYYSPMENIVIGKLIQNASKNDNNQDLLNREEKLEKAYSNLGIDKEMMKKQMPYEMSGGQRQRLSFIRAVTKDYSVILGDEPTGNLDDDTSEILMAVLKDSVRENHGRSAILVSHNILLSIAGSDRIIILSQGKETAYEVQISNVFDKVATGWINGDNKCYNDAELESLIKAILKQDKYLANLKQ